MDPLTVSAAFGLAKMLGVDKAIGKLFDSEKGGEIAGKVLDVAQVVTGSRSIADIEKAVNEDKEVASKLRIEILQMVDKEQERLFADRKSAREMQIAALGQDDVFSKRFLYYFAIAWSLFAMGYIVMITVAQINEANLRFADTILGFLLGTIVPTIIYFFFGSSKASQNKDVTIAHLADK